MSKSTYPLKLPNSIKAAAAQLAREEGVSLNQFIAAAVAEKVGVLRTTAEFLRERAGDAKPKDCCAMCALRPRLRRWCTTRTTDRSRGPVLASAGPANGDAP